MKTTVAYNNINDLLGIGLLSAAGLAYCVQPPLPLEFSFNGESTPVAETHNSAAQQADLEVEFLRFVDDKKRDLTLAEVEEILQKNLRGSVKLKAPELARHLLQLALHYRISPSLILSVIQAESGFRVSAKSTAGAMGLMQVRPSTASFIAAKQHIVSYQVATDLYDPFINLTIGVNYLSYLRHRFGNSIHYVAAYNLGPTSVETMLSAHKFQLGKVAKYVKGIHQNVYQLRGNRIVRMIASISQ